MSAFSLLTERRIRRGVHRNLTVLHAAITSFIDQHNADPKPFQWTNSADDILASIQRFCVYKAPVEARANATNFRTLELRRASAAVPRAASSHLPD
jgi:hypothetical protein